MCFTMCQKMCRDTSSTNLFKNKRNLKIKQTNNSLSNNTRHMSCFWIYDGISYHRITIEDLSESACYKGQFMRVREEILVSIAQKNRVEMAKWLVSKHPYAYELHLSHSNTITIKHFTLRTAKDARWHQRKYAIFMRQFSKPTILFQLPEDVSRFIIQKFI